MLYKPLFIIHVRVKGLFKLYCSTKQSTSVTKVGMAHAYQAFINTRFQVSVKTDEILLYNKSKQTRINKNVKKEVEIAIKSKETSI